jgi:hypothetical protein
MARSLGFRDASLEGDRQPDWPPGCDGRSQTVLFVRALVQVRISQRFRFASCKILPEFLGSQYAAQASINLRRFSSASLRR